MSTEKNLKDAFAGESQANRKYLAFAIQAEKEGHPQIARLFRATAEAETVHAMNHLKALKGVGSTAENLQKAIEGETFEYKDMYPPMIEEARKEGDKQAERTFRYANEVEEQHAKLYQQYKDNMDNLDEQDIYVCSVCGHLGMGEAPDNCPVCKAAKKAFMKVD